MAGDAGGEQIEGQWTPGTGLPSHADFYEHLRHQKPTRDTLLVDSKDMDQKLARPRPLVKATYHHPYQMHGSMGSSCAVADVQGDGRPSIRPRRRSGIRGTPPP